MLLEILSPEKMWFSGQVDEVKVPGAKGTFTILPRHAPIISLLIEGRVSYKVNGEVNSLYIASGLVEVEKNKVVVCIDQFTTEYEYTEEEAPETETEA